jgi:hypothetical protein
MKISIPAVLPIINNIIQLNKWGFMNREGKDYNERERE